MCLAAYMITQHPSVRAHSASTQWQTIGYSIGVNQERRSRIMVFCSNFPISPREKNDTVPKKPGFYFSPPGGGATFASPFVISDSRRSLLHCRQFDTSLGVIDKKFNGAANHAPLVAVNPRDRRSYRDSRDEISRILASALHLFSRPPRSVSSDKNRRDVPSDDGKERHTRRESK
jgi:hypothetical protein